MPANITMLEYVPYDSLPINTGYFMPNDTILLNQIEVFVHGPADIGKIWCPHSKLSNEPRPNVYVYVPKKEYRADEIKAYKATIELVIAADSEKEACDTVAETLREGAGITGVASGNAEIVDWRYAQHADGTYTRPVCIDDLGTE
jgi:hypothetical protein